ncbi:hypothetical protein FEA48_30725 [Pseudomonas nitroreducens]|uniref:Uncharacterized protein n=1 Tax=Pseudomonas nitroreducens TaxID=46680 RepID=A0A5R8ZSW9_PSENT|nr:hypothetical protein [Pseudomonas nitroreducens]TLP68230.1 hypothetical protein FEA48_30725 [Pseudomonas nitroreducens]
MSTVTINQYQKRQFGGFTPFGNLTSLAFTLVTNASGAALNSDSSVALAVGDVVDLGPLPEGMRLEDASVFIATGMTATITGSLGFKYEDGADDSGVPQDAAYFGAGIDLATTGRKRATGSKLVTLPKPARLILTTAVAANAKASDLKFLVSGELTGSR